MRWPRSPWVDVAVILVFTGLTVAMTWPAAARLDTHFVGGDIDVWHNPWATWWTRSALLEGEDLYYTRHLFYPEGVSLAFHSFSHVNSALELLLLPMLGYLGAYNVLVLASYALSGYGMFCLARHVTGSGPAGVFAGLIFAFFPYRLSDISRPIIGSTQWMPLFLLFVIRLLADGRTRHAVLAALFFVLTALSSWHLMSLSILLALAYALYRLVLEPRSFTRLKISKLAIAAILAGVPIGPFLFPLVREYATTAQPYVAAPLTWALGNDLLAFVLPPASHPVLGALTAAPHGWIGTTRSGYLGLSAVACCVAGAVLDWRRARFWMLSTLGSAALSIGPTLRIGGRDLGIPVPWAKAVVRLFRHPVRFNVLVGFGLAVAAGVGLAAVLRRIPTGRPRLHWLVIGATSGVLVFEYLCVPIPTTPAVVPSYYVELGATSGSGAILDLPMGHNPSKRYMYYQTVHHRPIFEGVVSRTPRDAYEYIERTPVLRSLRACGPDSLPPIPPTALAAELSNLGVEAVVYHKHRVAGRSLVQWREALADSPDYEDDSVAAFAVGEAGDREITPDRLLEACAVVRSVTHAQVEVTQGGRLVVPVEWLFGGTPHQAYVLELALVDSEGVTVETHQYEPVPGGALEAGSSYNATYPFSVETGVIPGQYDLRATLRPKAPDDRPFLGATLLSVKVSEPSGGELPPDSRTTAGATFGDCLQLDAYDLQAEGDVIRVVADWRALRKMTIDYKIFVHVYDRDGEVVAQHDAMPRSWTYPTTWWQTGAPVRDEATLSLGGIAPGVYEVALGVYDPSSGQRLEIAVVSSGLVTNARRLILGEVIRP